MEKKTSPEKKIPPMPAFNPEHYPAGNAVNIEADISPRNGRPMWISGNFDDIPLEDRHKYMWQIPRKLRNHQMYKEKGWGARIVREDQEKKEKEEKEEDDKKQKDKNKRERDNDDSIQLLLKSVADLTKQVNELTKQMKK
jgi:hypothetical protein